MAEPEYVRAIEAERDEAQARAERLAAAIENYLLWRPCEKGHAAAHRELRAALAAEKGT